MNDEQKDICQLALDHYGREHQMAKTIEECSELNRALARALFIEMDLTNLLEEIADVKIMIQQMEMKFCSEQGMDAIVERKLERLKKLILEDIEQIEMDKC